jgi:hypothetical protein
LQDDDFGCFQKNAKGICFKLLHKLDYKGNDLGKHSLGTLNPLLDLFVRLSGEGLVFYGTIKEGES